MSTRIPKGSSRFVVAPSSPWKRGLDDFVVLTKDNRESVFGDLDESYLRRVFRGRVIRFLPSNNIPGAKDSTSVIRETDAVAKGRLSWKARRALSRLRRQVSGFDDLGKAGQINSRLALLEIRLAGIQSSIKEPSEQRRPATTPLVRKSSTDSLLPAFRQII